MTKIPVYKKNLGLTNLLFYERGQKNQNQYCLEKLLRFVDSSPMAWKIENNIILLQMQILKEI